MKNRYTDKARGMFVGLAVGDALGAPVEFGFDCDMIRALGEKLSHFSDSPRGNAGEWTDDTSMALCIADSLLEKGGYDSYDIMRRFGQWIDDGYNTPDGKPAPDVGAQTRYAIDTFRSHPVVFRNEEETTSAGNGPIMRLAPIIIANTFPDKKYPTLKDGYKEGALVVDPKGDKGEFIDKNDISPTIEMAELSCRETHNSTTARAITEFFASMLYCALHGLTKNNVINYCTRWTTNHDYDDYWYEDSEETILRAFYPDDAPLRDLGGYIIDTFTIAIWGLLHTDNFEDGMMKVLSLGGDTDTNGACYGQLAGAYYGYKAIPSEWKKGVCYSEELVDIADRLLAMEECPILKTRFEDNRFFKEPE